MKKYVEPLLVSCCDRTIKRGFTLVELMVAMTLGLLLMSVIGYAFLQGRTTMANQDANLSIVDDMRFISDIFSRITRNARRASWGSDLATLQPSLKSTNSLFVGGSSAYSAVLGTSAPFMPTELSNTACPVVNATPAGSLVSDCLIVSYMGSGDAMRTSANFALGDGTITDCLGNTVGVLTVVANQFYVANGALRCRTYYKHLPELFGLLSTDLPASLLSAYVERSDANDIILLSNVESVRFLFGEDLGLANSGAPTSAFGGSTPSITTRYMFEPNRWLAAGSTGLDMRRVAAIRYSAIIRSPTPLVNQVGLPTTLNHFSQGFASLNTGYTYTVPNDGRVRKVLTGTITLRNMPAGWSFSSPF